MTLKTLKALAVVTAGIVVSMPAPGPAMANSISGAYLAARHASHFSDYEKAAEYYTLALAREPGNPQLLEDAISAFVGLGDLVRAVPIARKMEADGLQSQTANMVLIADLAEKGDFAAILKQLDQRHSVGGLVDGLVRAWALLGEAQTKQAMQAFDKVSQGKGTGSFGLYHKALALASIGDFEAADQILSGAAAGPVRATRHGIIAHAQVLSQLGRDKDALQLLDATLGTGPDPRLAGMRRKLEAGKTLSFTVVSTADQGIAEVFYTVAGALNSEADDNYTLIFSRVSESVNPKHTDALLLTADLFDRLKRYDLAIDTYKRIGRDDPAYYVAELGRADALGKEGKTGASIEVLEQLSKTYPDLAVVQVTLGDSLRRTEDFKGAATAYSRALDLYGAPKSTQWFVYYTRGIAYERLNQWENSEADLREALKLRPNQPNVLNYLGYSLVEKGIKLDEALKLIQQAVAAKPDDGYITDSLGWVLYQLGRYDEAVKYMERATEQMPTDATINDHLGDVYWAVGRHREARVQWRRALSFDPGEADATRIRRKLQLGLDAVLKAEGAAPVAVSANGG